MTIPEKKSSQHMIKENGCDMFDVVCGSAMTIGAAVGTVVTESVMMGTVATLFAAATGSKIHEYFQQKRAARASGGSGPGPV